MAAPNERRVKVDADGRLILPEGTAASLGFAPGARVLLEDLPNGVVLRRAASHLS